MLLFWNDPAWLEKCVTCVPHPWAGKHPGREPSRVHGDSSPTGSWGASPTPTREETTDATQVEGGHNLRSNLKMLWFHSWGFHSFWQVQAAQQGSIVCSAQEVTPAEEHAPTNKLISDMNCGVFRCSAHSFPSLLWAEFMWEPARCSWTNPLFYTFRHYQLGQKDWNSCYIIPPLLFQNVKRVHSEPLILTLLWLSMIEHHQSSSTCNPI